MKKLLSVAVVFVSIVMIIGCTNTTATTSSTSTVSSSTTTTSEVDNTVYSVMVPNGGPAVAQMYMQNQPDKYAVDVVNGPDPLVAAFGSGSHDFIFAGTNLGAKLYTSNQAYIFIAVSTLGNSYLVTQTGEDFTLASLEGKEIIVFGQNATSDIVLRYILSESGINCTFTYVDSVATATSLWVADHSKIILTAEPSLSVLLGSNPDLDIIDLQTEYSLVSGFDSYPQASVFAKTTLSNEAINQFLTDLEASINLVNSNVAASAQLGEELGFGFTSSVLENSIPNNHLSFISALDARSNLESYFNILIDINPALIGGALPVDAFYYNPSR